MNMIQKVLLAMPILFAACATAPTPTTRTQAPQMMAASAATMKCAGTGAGGGMMSNGGGMNTGQCACMKTMKAGAANTTPKPTDAASPAKPTEEEHKAHHPDGKK